MSYLDDYNARINVVGNTIGQSQLNTSADFINITFTDSPFYQLAKLNDTTDLDVRLMDISSITRSSAIVLVQYALKFIMLRPGMSLNIGDKVTLEDSTDWLVTDFTGEDPLFPKAKIEICNYTLNVKTGETSTLIGYDSLKRPKYNVTSTTESVPVVLRNGIAISAMNQSINLPNDNMFISMQYNDVSKLINENDKFDIYNKQYKVTGLDFTNINHGVGIITFLTERVVNTQ